MKFQCGILTRRDNGGLRGIFVAVDLAGKVAVVTGASRGIGKSLALGLANVGATVVCTATKKVNAEPTAAQIEAEGGQAIALECLVEVKADVERAFNEIHQQFERLDILINNAGISKPMRTLDMTEENWDEHMNVNAKSIFLCSQAGARIMKANGGGAIVNIGSILGQNAFPATLGYCASKATVDHMTRVMAIEWARFNIRVNCVAPGYVRTELIDGLINEGKLAVDDLEKRTPQRRLGTGEEVSHAVNWVASDEASFMTGEVLNLDGGWNAFGMY